ncbi:hypothetical protein [Paenarthrobacter nitroguajacolicus]|uniref:hypothetical protein n=1 Tax=Paenarthrobacter nitroguajacolicus TaxID=211146 RepID=UPI002858B1E0|nr:hypothetical protein [Paenarthrobacter nitroguajacolicus]MDR6636658.1 uncharacterized protein involved in exopolysaccharide biosynthesis [Paenarthrobacter nitroguajacolicus]
MLLGLLLTVAFCYLVQQTTPEKYKSQASLVIMPSAHSVGEDGNPYLNLGGMGEALDILTRRLSSEEVRKQIAADFPNATYTAETDKGTSGAILLITATSPDPNDSLGTTQAVMKTAPTLLGQMQEALNVPETSRISTMTLLVDGKATPETKARTQILLISAAGGVGLTLVLVVLVDSLLKTRATRKTRPEAPTQSQRPIKGFRPRRITARPGAIPVIGADTTARTRHAKGNPQRDGYLDQDELKPPVPSSQMPTST